MRVPYPSFFLCAQLQNSLLPKTFDTLSRSRNIKVQSYYFFLDGVSQTRQRPEGVSGMAAYSVGSPGLNQALESRRQAPKRADAIHTPHCNNILETVSIDGCHNKLVELSVHKNQRIADLATNKNEDQQIQHLCSHMHHAPCKMINQKTPMQ